MSAAPAPSPAEQAVIDRFDAAPVPPEVVVETEGVERAAAALAGLDGILWNSLSEKIGTCDYYRSRAATSLAAAAIAADPSPAEEAGRFVYDRIGRAELDRLRGLLTHPDRNSLTTWEVVEIAADEIAQLRAALASPAPAPQETWTFQTAEVPVPHGDVGQR